MSYRYLAVLQDEGRHRKHDVCIDLARRPLESEANRDITLFASEDTPSFELPDGGTLIGHLFDHTGASIIDAVQFPDTRDPVRLRQHIVQDCWGEYVLIQPLGEQRGYAVMHSPSVSCGLGCLYAHERGRSFITSDISLATRAGLYQREIDWDYLRCFLAYPFLRTERTALAGINELLPGMLATLGTDQVGTKPIWSPWDFIGSSGRYAEFQEAACSIREAVSMAVRAFARVDQSVLLELSGGLDSSIIGACLRNSSVGISCATLVTPVPGADERKYAAHIAELLDVDLQAWELPIEAAHFSFPDPADPVRPSVGPLQYAIDTVMSKASDALHVGSAFSGGGGDTIFGYLRTAAPAADAFKEKGVNAAFETIQDLAVLHQCTFWRALRLTFRKLLRTARPPYQPDLSFLMPSTKNNARMDHPWFQAPKGALPGDRERIFELAGNQIFMDYAPRRTGRFFRMPLLSQPVVEACLRAPSWMWIANGQNRALARAAFSSWLPHEILSRRSKGTFMSYLGEAYQCKRKQMLDFLVSGHLCSRGILDATALQRFDAIQLPARDRSFTRILDLCRVENWIRQQYREFDELSDGLSAPTFAASIASAHTALP